MSSLFALSPSKLAANVTRILQARLVPLIRSSPGMGKSDILNALGKEYRLKVYDFRLSQADITDFNGLPFRDENGRADFLPFKNFPLEGDELPDHPDGGKYDGWLLFFDEITSAPKQLQAASYKILLERLVGNHRLHEKVMVACAGNLESDKAVVHSLSTALQSRLIHLELRVDHGEWMQWAAKNNIDPRIMAYLEFRPDNLHNFDPDHTDHTFACPRTWEFASRLIRGHEITTEDLPLLAGTVSAGIAQEFVGFVEVFSTLPKLADIIANPKGAPIPSEPAAKYAVATHLADQITKANVNPIAEYIFRLPVEIQVISLRMLNNRHPQLTREPAVVALWQKLATYL